MTRLYLELWLGWWRAALLPWLTVLPLGCYPPASKERQLDRPSAGVIQFRREEKL